MKCRQTLKAMTEILQQESAATLADRVCSVVGRCLGDARVYLVNSKGYVIGRSVATGATSGAPAVKAPANSPTPNAGEDHSAGALTPRTIASLGAAAAARKGPVSATIDRHTYAAAPITVLGEAFGMLLVRLDREFSRDDRDVLLALAAASGAMLAARRRRDEEEHETNQRVTRSAIRSLSYSELVAIHAILDSITGDQGFVVASRIADAAGMTRSVVVNALRKLSSAGLVKTKSLGMKGMFVKFLNPELRNELQDTAVGRGGVSPQIAASAASPADSEARSKRPGSDRAEARRGGVRTVPGRKRTAKALVTTPAHV